MTRPAVATTPAAFRELCQSRQIILVPTMGGLHAGHLALVTKARKLADHDSKAAVCVSIFVNPLQFGSDEDFARYPRRLDEDLAKLGDLADVCYVPESSSIYAQKQEILIHAPRYETILCGRSRPGHFTGVLTLVLKLFNQTRARTAVFGRKDFQQLQLIRAMVKQLDLQIAIHDIPIVREPDMLAYSSRNAHLSLQQRTIAPQLYAQLSTAAKSIADGTSAHNACQTAKAKLQQAGFVVDYVECRDHDLVAHPKANNTSLLVFGAASLGNVRLIDNVAVGD